MMHKLKTHPDPFDALVSGHKRHEIRKHDRPFAEGDRLLLQEWCPVDEDYTGREALVEVTYKSEPGSWGLPDNLCVMSISYIEGKL